MTEKSKTKKDLLREIEEQRAKLFEAEEVLSAIQRGEVDAIVGPSSDGDHVYTLVGAEQPYRIFFEEMNEGALTLSGDRTILYCNRSFADLLRAPIEKLIGTYFLDAINEDSRPDVEALLSTAGTGIRNIEAMLRTHEGTTVPVNLSANFLNSMELEVVCLLVLDMRNLKMMRSLEEANKRLIFLNEQLRASNEKQQMAELKLLNSRLAALNLMEDAIEAHKKVEQTNKGLQCEIDQRKQAEDKLLKAYAEVDQRVKERTTELNMTNEQLLQEIEDRKKAEESLREILSEVKLLKNRLREENLYLREVSGLTYTHKNIVGNSEAIRAVLNQIEQVAMTDSLVLIQGDTGTGKEMVANAIHAMSSRKDKLMIKVNCGALPPTLIESELFGREKGAFTGALAKQIGRFELADNSTIFLDEIDSMPLELQAKLLRVVENGEFERLGSPKTVKVDVRIISATNRDLAKVVSEGGFREDLYYRLNVFQIVVPPLRERQEDILPLVWSFVQYFSKKMGKRVESIPQQDVQALLAYPWKGNVRELRNITERAMIITTGPVLHLDMPKVGRSETEQAVTLAEVEKKSIIEALNSTQWQVSGKNGAARILGINPKTLASRMQKLGIQRNKKNI